MTTVGDQFLKSTLYGFCLGVYVTLRYRNAGVARDSRQREGIAPGVSEICQRGVSQAIRFKRLDFG